MKLGELTTNHLQIYMSVVEVASNLFGKSDKSKPKVVNDMSPEEAVASLNSLFQSAGAG